MIFLKKSSLYFVFYMKEKHNAAGRAPCVYLIFTRLQYHGTKSAEIRNVITTVAKEILS